MQPHPLSLLFPDMSSHDYAILLSDIKKNGLREKIVTHQGKILDGRHRWKACEELAITPHTSEYKGNDAAAYVMSKNFARRNLTTSQRAAIAATMKESLAPEAKERMSKGGKKKVAQICATLGKSSEKAAELAGVSTRSVETAASIRAQDEDLFGEVVAGTKTLNAAVEEVKRKNPTAPIKEKDPLEKFKDDAQELREISRTLHTLGKRLLEICETPIGRQLNYQSIEADIAHLKAEINTSLPHALCPYCKKGCKVCKQNGWVTRGLWANAPEEMKVAR